MPRVVHFEIHAANPERAIRFYKSVFEWEFTRFAAHEYWVIRTGATGQPGIDGGLVPRKGPLDGTAVIAYVCTIAVNSVDKYLMKIRTSGGQQVADKMAVSGIGWLAYCKDTEGNIFGILEADSNAK